MWNKNVLYTESYRLYWNRAVNNNNNNSIACSREWTENVLLVYRKQDSWEKCHYKKIIYKINDFYSDDEDYENNDFNIGNI